MNQKSPAQNILQTLPTKWAIVLVVGLIIYALAQPWANRTLGWHLPSLTGQSEESPSAAKDSKGPKAKGKTGSSSDAEEDSKESRPTSKTDAKSGSTASEDRELRVDPPSKPEKKAPQNTGNPAGIEKKTQSPGLKKEASLPKKDAVAGSDPKDKKEKLYGILTEVGRDRFQSPAGLIYGPGGEEGHRLKHLERHLQDQPDRPGKHGVFDGDMASALRWIDDGFSRASKGAKGTTKKNDEGRMVYEASFDKPIGFIGGRDGKRDGNPPAKRVRIVVDDKKVITAFPF